MLIPSGEKRVATRAERIERYSEARGPRWRFVVLTFNNTVKSGCRNITTLVFLPLSYGSRYPGPSLS